MATALDLIDSALREIGVLAASETAPAQDATDALARLNRYLDRLATEKLTIYTRTRTTWTLTSGDGSYTVGPLVTDVVMARPVFVDEVHYIDRETDPDTEYPLDRLTEQAYAAIAQKDQTALRPQAWYYNPTFPNATLILWPAPTDDNLHGAIYAWTALTQIASLATVISLPPGYEEMLLTNLALLLCPTYERQPSPVLVETARETKAAIKRANRRPQDMSFEPAALGSRGAVAYDIFRG